MGRLQTGLLSVTFRELTAERIVRIAADAGLAAIEWGGDIHVPHGDTEIARTVGRMTRESGLSVRSYGSYYRLGVEGLPFRFEDALASAVALGAPAIRVWAGDVGSEEANEETWSRVVADANRAAALAAGEGVVVCLEYHNNTLTDTCDTTVRLLREASHSNLRTLWQPALKRTPAERLGELKRLAPWLEYVHAYYWDDSGRRPFAEGAAEWRRYLEALLEMPGEKHVMLEFVRDNDPEQLLADAAELTRLAGFAAPAEG